MSDHLNETTERSWLQLLAPYLEAAGVPGEWPMSRTSVCRVIEAADYLFTETMLADAIRRESITPPPVVDGRDAWSIRDVAELLAVLEKRECWKPFPSQHDHKKTPIRLKAEVLLSDGQSGELAGLLADNTLAEALNGAALHSDETQRRNCRDIAWAKIAAAAVLTRQNGGRAMVPAEEADEFGFSGDWWKAGTSDHDSTGDGQ